MDESIKIDASGVPPREEENVCEKDIATAAKTKNANTDSEAEETEFYVGDERKNSESISDSGSVLSDVSQVHDKWSLNALLLDIADELKPEEFSNMRFMFIEEIGRGSLQQMTNPVQLFDAMRKRQLITSVNLLHLCALLKIVKRNDLIQKIVDYSQNTEDSLYMQPATLTPVNGYRHVQFHVRGRDFTRIKKQELHYFRNSVAAMLSMPTQFVLIDGVNPSSSIIITLLLPAVHAEIFQRLLESNNESVTIELTFARVDRVNVGGRTFVVQEIDSELTIDETKQKDIALCDKLHDLKRCLDTTESENIALKKELNQMEKTLKEEAMKYKRIENEVMRLQTENDVWRLSAKPKHFFEDDDDKSTNYGSEYDSNEQKPADIIKVLENFKDAVDQMSAENCNKQLVLKLLQSHVTLISTRCYNEVFALITKVMIQMKGFADMMISTATIAQVKKLMGDIDIKDEPDELKVLRKISSKISLKERRMLEEAYNFDKEDKDIVERGIFPFLFILLQKEHGETGAELNMTECLRKCLTKIDRIDLLLMFIQEVRTLSTERTKTPIPRQKGEILQSNKELTMESIAKHLKMLVEKVDKIDSRLTAMHAMPSIDNIKNMESDYANLLYKHMQTERAGACI